MRRGPLRSGSGAFRGAAMSVHAGLLARLGRSRFRGRFRLSAAERGLARAKGAVVIRAHAQALLAARLGPARPVNDGRQTPMRGHPVFVAQHATATCCRGCLAKWHGIAEGRALSAAELAWIADLLIAWIAQDLARAAQTAGPGPGKGP